MKNRNQHNTAILLFANSASYEWQWKKTIPKKELFEALTVHTLSVIEASGMPYFHLTEKEQFGGSFAERFSNAIQWTFKQGFDQVITIGNDSPNLTVGHLLQAASNISQNSTVIGPSSDGGIYLLGIHKSNFDSVTFKKLPWQHVSLLKATEERFSQSRCSIFKLDALQDVDSLSDLKQFYRALKGSALFWRQLISKLLQPTGHFNAFTSWLYDSGHHSLYHNKGSPLSFA